MPQVSGAFLSAASILVYNKSTMKYLTQILDKRLVSTTGEKIGTIVDAIATLEGRLPSVRALIARVDGKEIYLPYGDTDFDEDPAGPTGSGQINSDIRLLKSL